MNTTKLKKFAQGARRQLLEQVAARLEQVLRSDSVEIREKVKAVAELRGQIDAHGKEAVIDRVAYTWFNRFCALRFMDVNHYTQIGGVSPVEGGTQPEVLLEAKQGHVEDDLARFVAPQVIFNLLNGQRPASDPQGEAYRLLLVGICNSYNEVMPFMFEKIEDYTELLMPLDLLSENSVLHDLREALTPETCKDVEVIGWLYQYYISERKDKVFEALKQNQKIEAADIPAATQLFTPHWIVRYLVENSLGRLWMLNHPDSKLIDQMEYYIKPAQVETDFLKSSSPEEIKLNDPACGSGHILTYAFDLLYAIYEEEGYASSDIPKLILEKNIFGVEIDPRAGALAAFALVMKARAKDRRFFTRNVSPNICVLENVTFNEAELKQYMNAVGLDLFTVPLMETLRQFEQADNFGSLIRPLLTDAGYVRGLLEGKNLGGDLFLFGVHERVLKVLKQAEFLAPRYHVVVANPPYMGGKGMNDDLKDFAKDEFPNSQADLFAMFIERNIQLTVQKGTVGMITMQSWMFLSSFEKLRTSLLANGYINTMAHLGARAFDTIGGEIVSTTAFCYVNLPDRNFRGTFFRLIEGGNENEKASMLRDKNSGSLEFFAAASDFAKIPGNIIAYWISVPLRELFEKTNVEENMIPKFGMSVGDGEKFIRYWHEVSFGIIGFGYHSGEKFGQDSKIWAPLDKGGQYRKWYGNKSHVVFWKQNGKAIKEFKGSAVRSHHLFFQPHFSWTLISSSNFSVRYFENGYTLDTASNCLYFHDKNPKWEILAFLNSKICQNLANALNPTMNFSCGVIGKLPYVDVIDKTDQILKIVDYTKQDWDAFELSWEYKAHPLTDSGVKSKTVSDSFEKLYAYWMEKVKLICTYETDNNQILIDKFNLSNDFTSDVPFEDVTLNFNPYYRYGGNRSEEELEELLRADTMREFISYAVGCMFGRYSFDKPGLVLASQGETVEDYLKQVPLPTFMPDEDNVIPVLEGEWFEDDIAERFKKFLRLTFGEEHYDENLAFIEGAIGRDVRGYFVKEFYKEHVQMYKKRPIYWMFSSPKGSFNALIYMHRYQSDTVSIVLNDYLREYIKKLQAHKSHLDVVSVSGSASQSQKTKALKEIAQVNKVLSELKEYESDVLFPLATEQVKIDLDDGVKVNYKKFGEALSPIKGL
jgi:type II restriction/modification system DNA methylase subunit YeeA